jgi:hypothetical protein
VHYLSVATRISTPHEYCLGDQTEKIKMGGAYSTYGRVQRCIQDLVGTLGFHNMGGNSILPETRLDFQNENFMQLVSN